jgi:hypothetical protein
MRTETDTNAKRRGGRIAAENTTALTSSLGMRSTGKRRGNDKSGKSAATKISTPPVISDYMTTREAAAYVKLSRQYLEAARYRGDGSGPPYIKLERAVRYRRSTLDAWMSAHDHSPDKPIAR